MPTQGGTFNPADDIDFTGSVDFDAVPTVDGVPITSLSTPPGGSDGQVQINDNGVFAGTSIVEFPEAGGLSFDTGDVTPTTIICGDDVFGDPAVNIANASSDAFFSFPGGAVFDFVDQCTIFGSITDDTVARAGVNLSVDAAGFDLTSMYGYWTQYTASGNSVLTNMSALYMIPTLADTAAVTNVYGAYFVPQAIPVGATVTNSYAFYSNDLTTFGTNPYFLWYTGTGTGAGVFRVNGLGILAYYNPAFATYTPGSTNYERIVLQWNTNVAEIGVEAGGTGTLRAVKVIGASLQAASYKSNDGTAGATAGPFTVITGIAVKNGIVTTLTGS